ncbi:hypothetical protein [Bradyrhizobium sp. S3.7.6]
MSSRKCRAVIVAKNGSRYLTRWLTDKPATDLGPDEMPAITRALAQARRLADRKQIEVDRIDGMFLTPKEK